MMETISYVCLIAFAGVIVMLVAAAIDAIRHPDEPKTIWQAWEDEMGFTTEINGQVLSNPTPEEIDAARADLPKDSTLA